MKNHNSLFSFKEIITKIALALAICLVLTVLLLPLGKNVASAKEIHAGCKAVYLVDADSNTEMYSHRCDDRLPIASMVKIMTSLLAFEAVERGELSLDEMIEVSSTASGMGGSQVFLDCNEKYNAGELLKSIVVASANDSCVAIAERLAGSVEGFVSKMNIRAKELGMNNTNFVNCTGLPAPENYSSAKDVSIMFKKLISYPAYFEYAGVWLEDFKHPDGRVTTMTNTNKLVKHYNGCDGGKTGFTSEAKFCLSATACRGGLRVIAVVIGSDSSKERFGTTSQLFNYAFANYSSKVIKAESEEIENSVRVLNGKDQKISVGFDRDIRALVKSGSADEYDLKINLPQTVKAPIVSGQEIGKAYLTRNGEVIGEYPIVALKDVDKANYGDLIKRICHNW